jgi:hypothetical protein
MKKPVNYSLILLAVAAASLSAACSSDEGDNNNNNNTGGTGGNVVLVPSDTGWVDKSTNSLGIQGSWYAYGDSFGSTGLPPGSCQDPAKGNHQGPDDCSKVTTPDPAAGKFPPDAAKGMCTSGLVAKVPPKVGGSGSSDYDYSNVWGAGIGLDFGAPDDSTTGAAKKVADLSGMKGISFILDAKPVAGLRVELPMPATEGGQAGSNYWGAVSGSYGNSPVVPGLNTFMWTDVKAPGTGTAVTDPTQLLGIQFHVPTTTSSTGSYAFCIKDLTILK